MMTELGDIFKTPSKF